jgi:hypothetical protein
MQGEMTEQHSVAKQYRDSVRYDFKMSGSWTEAPDSDPSDRAFYDFLERDYEQTKEFLAYLLGEKATLSENNRVAIAFRQSYPNAENERIADGVKFHLYLIAAGLFTFGRLDMAEVMLDNRREGIGLIARYIRTLSILTPLPQSLGPQLYLERWPQADKLKRVKEWFEANKTKLRWNEAKERYEWIEPSEGRNR